MAVADDTDADHRQQRPTRIAIGQRTTATRIPSMTSAMARIGRERSEVTSDTETLLIFTDGRTLAPWPSVVHRGRRPTMT